MKNAMAREVIRLIREVIDFTPYQLFFAYTECRIGTVNKLINFWNKMRSGTLNGHNDTHPIPTIDYTGM